MHSIRILTLLLVSWSAANAAEIDVRRLDNGSMLILVEGEFERGDIRISRCLGHEAPLL